ncbi:hypothetical protein BJ912DRAFT_1023704 [Pholiota molesta]|nr:hypothetical protein BJ912DRAFT_1023704 [Pholiota molesta]
MATKIGAKTQLKAARMNSGVKDTTQEFFITKLIDSPVWLLKGLDPHQDTPVEVLHVVLLGFIKYFWRDLITNQITDVQKPLLIQRLNSYDVNGLGISQIGGDTLVNYSGSLTGRDFRTISQVAPFVIYDLVPVGVFEAWLSLAKLVPLIYQPVIEDINRFIVMLTHEIKTFLLTTARWTTRWFNKANIHSNRQAPSRDIALGFAQGNRIRHLLSGGYFLEPTSSPDNPNIKTPPSALFTKESDWKSIGIGPTQLVAAGSTVPKYLGIPASLCSSVLGQCKRDKTGPHFFSQTLTGLRLPSASTSHGGAQYETSEYVYLMNGDKCSVGQYVIAQLPHSGALFIACVREILQRVGSENHRNQQADGILIQSAQITTISQKFQMPELAIQDKFSFVPISNILCTVNTPHNCDRNHCTANGFQYIYQERVQTSHRRPIVLHEAHPNDLILNTAQMRDAVHVQNFRIPSPPITAAEEERMIHDAVAATINARKAPTSRGRGARGAALRGGIGNATHA